MFLSKSAIRYWKEIIADFTRESGVRELDRQLAAIMRSLARAYAEKGKLKPTVTAKDVERILGRSRYNNEMYKTSNMPELLWVLHGRM